MNKSAPDKHNCRVTKKIIAEEPRSGCNKIKEIRETIMKMGFQKPVQFDRILLSS